MLSNNDREEEVIIHNNKLRWHPKLLKNRKDAKILADPIDIVSFSNCGSKLSRPSEATGYWKQAK